MADFRDNLWGFYDSQHTAINLQKSIARSNDMKASEPGGMKASYKPAILDPARKRAIIEGQMQAQQPRDGRMSPSGQIHQAAQEPQINAQDGGHTAGGAQAVVAQQANPQGTNAALTQALKVHNVDPMMYSAMPELFPQVTATASGMSSADWNNSTQAAMPELFTR